MRLSLGAGSGRILRQLLSEGLLLALLGTAVGLLVAFIGRQLLWGLRPAYVPDFLELRFDPVVLGFTLAVAVLAGVLVSLVPANQVRRLDLSTELKDRSSAGNRSRRRLSAALVVAQVALSLIVLSGAGLFLQSLRQLQQVDAGFDTDNLFLLPISLGQRYTPATGQALFEQAASRVAAVPGVRGATLSSRPALAPGGNKTPLAPEAVEGRAGVEKATAAFNFAVPGYFQTMGISLLAGRDFSDQDRPGGSRVAIINETLAEWFWTVDTAVGERMQLDIVPGQAYEIVGVVKDSKYNSLSEAPQPYLYVASQQHYSPVLILHVRSAEHPSSVIAQVRREVQSLDPELPLLEARLISDLIDYSLWPPRMIASLLTLFGLVALVLCAVGVFGIVAYNASQRHREMGIRIAMGATRRDVLSDFLSQGMKTGGIGIVLGLIAAGLLYSRIKTLLFDIHAADPVAYLGALVPVLIVIFMAVILPARRAANIEPATVLRDE